MAFFYGYWVPAEVKFKTVGQGIVVGKRDELEQCVGRVAEVPTNGLMPSGALRHHRLIRRRSDKGPEDCVMEMA